MKKILLIVLFISVGFCQELIRGVDTDEYGTVKITYYKETQNQLEKVKYVEYYDNGQKKEEITYKDGKPDGLWSWWHENGQKKSEGTYKDGKEDELVRIKWYSNGQKRSERMYKSGKYDGLSTFWYMNGQKWHEGTYKDGERISSKYWNEDGSVQE